MRRRNLEIMRRRMKEGLTALFRDVGVPYAKEIVSVPKVLDEPTPIGGPPRRRSGKLRNSIRYRIYTTKTGFTGVLTATAKSEDTGAPYPLILENPEGFMAWGRVPLGPYPFLKRAFDKMRANAGDYIFKKGVMRYPQEYTTKKVWRVKVDIG